MKVLLVFTYGYSLKTWEKSGTLAKELELYNKLSSKYGIKFIFLTYGDTTDIEINLNNEDIKVVPIYSFIKKYENKLLNYIYSFFIPFKVYKKFKEIEKINIIKQNQLIGSWVSVILKFLLKKPLYIRTGYDMYKFSIDEKKNSFIVYLYKILTKFSFYYSNFYTVSSKSDIRFLNSELGLGADKLFLRPNFIATKTFNDYKNRYRNKILCVGRLERQKNYEYLIKELSGTGIELDIVGRGSLEKELIEISKKFNIKLNLLGKIDNHQLKKVYQKYSYFVNPSLFEGCPKTVLEALSNGCVVIASNIPNHSEIITNYENGYIFDLKPNAFKNLILNINEDKNIQVIKNAQNTLKSRFLLDSAIEVEYKDYKNLLG